MLEWTHAHPWMTFTALLVLVGNLSARIAIRRRGRRVKHPAHGEHARGDRRTTPEQVRDRMLSPRQRAARAVAEAIKSFCADGNPDAVMLVPYDDVGDKAMIAELLEYKAEGWEVEFHRDYAAVQLPEVVS